MNVVYFGTSQESLPALKALMQDARFDVRAVVTQPPRAVGRRQVVTKSAVHLFAEAQSVEVLTPAFADEAMEDLKRIAADVHVVVSFGQILPDELVDLPPHGTVNVHPSLLPLHRGATPVPAAIIAGDEETGVAIMKMDEKMDHGPLLHVRGGVPIGTKTGGVLLQELMELGASDLPDVLARYVGGELAPVEQDHDQATFCSLLRRKDARIQWEQGSVQVERMIRAYDPWPGAWTEVEYKKDVWRRLKILKAHIDPSREDVNKGLCADGSDVHVGQLVIDELQFAGKNPITGKEFASAHESYCRTLR